MSDLHTNRRPLRALWRAALGSLLLVAAGPVDAASLFDSHDVLELSVTGPLRTLIDSDHREELPFTLSVRGDELPVRVRKRGKSRLTVCNFPPLRINFSRHGEAGLFAGQNKLKLVTHCKDTHAAEQDLLREYSAYRLFNAITALSYRVRMARVSYFDSSGELFAERAAFLVESGNALGRRHGLVRASRPHVTLNELDQLQAAMVFVFQYMIGNTDWSLVKAELDDECCHNIDLFERDDTLIVVPFDFDLSGIVNARHARPDPSLGIRDVTIRRYRGYCVSPDAVEVALQSIMASRQALLDVLDDVPGLDKNGYANARRYLERFLEQSKNERRLLMRFERACL